MLPNKLSNKLPNLCPSVKGLGHKFGNLLLSPFTLATCAATNLRAVADSDDQRRPLANGTDENVPQLVAELVEQHVASVKAL